MTNYASDCPRCRIVTTLLYIKTVSPRAQVAEAVSCTRRCPQSATRPRAQDGRPRRRPHATGTRGRPRRSAPCPGMPCGAARQPCRRRPRGVARAWRRCRLRSPREARGVSRVRARVRLRARVQARLTGVEWRRLTRWGHTPARKTPPCAWKRSARLAASAPSASRNASIAATQCGSAPVSPGVPCAATTALGSIAARTSASTAAAAAPASAVAAASATLASAIAADPCPEANPDSKRWRMALRAPESAVVAATARR
eukprot:scaffold407_cov66-Phaeocystis_antarctica.AAC.1